MTQVVLFHSILGLRPGVRALAARLTAAGHPTVAPDLYEGRATGNVDEGFAIHREIGRSTILARARNALADLPPRTVLAGISAGAPAAVWLMVAAWFAVRQWGRAAAVAALVTVLTAPLAGAALLAMAAHLVLGRVVRVPDTLRLPVGGLLGGVFGQWFGARTALWIGAIGACLAFLPVFLSPLRTMRELPTRPDDEAPRDETPVPAAQG